MNTKKLISLVLAFILAVTPMVAFAEESPLGSYENPYQLYANSLTPLIITVAPGTDAYVQADLCDNSVVTVGHATHGGYFLQYGRQTVYPAGDNTAEFTMNTFSDMFSVYNSGETDVVVYIKLAEGAPAAAGTMDNPEEIVLAKNFFGNLGANLTADLEAGNEGHYYVYYATADGYFTVNISAFDAEYNSVGWMYNVQNVTAGIYGDNHWSDEDEPVYYESVKVSAGDKVMVFASTYDPANMWNNPVGTVAINASFDPIGSMNFPAEITEGEQSVVLEEGNQGYHCTWTAPENGTVTVAINGESWQYNVMITRPDGSAYYGDNHYSDDEEVVPSEEHTVSAGDVVSVFVATYDPANMWANPAGTVEWSLTFLSGEGETPDTPPEEPVTPPTGDGKEDGYFESGVSLLPGTNEYELSADNKYTVFYFEPAEIGKYIFTAANGYVALVSYNGMWVTIEPSAETVTGPTFEWECQDVGQSILVAAISDDASVTISVEKEELIIVEIPVIKYENKVTPQSFVLEGSFDDMLYVDTFDDVLDVAVLGNDGFYHLGSENGPILYVCLSDPWMNLTEAMNNGQLKDVIYDGDEVIGKIDYNEAFAQYVECADADSSLYPLTEDLIVIFKGAGSFHNWYGEDGWVGGDLEDAWMFACYYFEQVEPVYEYGDVNADGNVNVLDYAMVKSHCMHLKELSAEQQARADMNGDGRINVLDYGILKKLIMSK